MAAYIDFTISFSPFPSSVSVDIACLGLGTRILISTYIYIMQGAMWCCLGCQDYNTAKKKPQPKSKMKFEMLALPQHSCFSITPALVDIIEIINSQCYWS